MMAKRISAAATGPAAGPDSADDAHHWMAMKNRNPIAAHMRDLLPPDGPAAQ